MRPVVQHAVSLVVPVTVLIVVPALIEKHPVVASGALLVLGVYLLLAGLYVMVQTMRGFARVGKGTLAP